MQSKVLGCGLVGCGSMGESLVSHLPGLPNARLVAVTDENAAQAQGVVDRIGGDVASSLNDLLSRDDIQAVFIATPGFSHADITEKAFAAGKHVFSEKPMALNPADCECMISARDATGRKLMVGQVLRYIGVFEYTRRLQMDGRLGEIGTLRITRTANGWGSASRPWRDSERICGGLLCEFGVHELDFMMTLAGEAKSVHAVSRKIRDGGYDYHDMYQINILFHSGATGQLTAGIADPIGIYNGEIVGSDGAVHFDMSLGQIKSRVGDADVIVMDPSEFDYENPVRREVREFVEAVLDDTPVTIPGEDGLRVIRLVDAARCSALEGRVIEL
jgi:UDP-N-acetylglucosamine 3-dehydrogenase